MKFLSKLGQILIKGTQLITGIGPLFPQYERTITQVEDTLTKIIGVVINVEAFGVVLGTPGPDKLKASIPVIGQIIMAADVFKNRKIKDHTLFQAGIEKIAGGTADVMNSFDDNIDTKDVTA